MTDIAVLTAFLSVLFRYMHLVSLSYCPKLIPERRKKSKNNEKIAKRKKYIYTYFFKKNNESFKTHALSLKLSILSSMRKLLKFNNKIKKLMSCICHKFNQFLTNVTFLYPPKTSENLTVFYFQRAEV